MIRAALAALCLVLAATTARAQIEIQQITSPGGIDAWLVEEHDIPFVAIEIAFRGGAGLDEPGKRGAAYLMTALIEEGAGDMDAREFQTAREDLAASFGFDTYGDYTYISARVLTENRDAALGLLRSALTDPRFDEDAIERVRGQVLSGIRSDLQSPRDIAGDTWFAEAFGDHPYGSAITGTLDSVSALTRDDIVTAHRNLLVRDRVTVAAVGDITPDELGAVIDALIGGLPEGGPDLPDDVAFGVEGGVTTVDFPTPQAVIYFGHDGIERDDPDFFAAFVLNRILGEGTFESRLGTELRVRRGLTYGIGTSLVPMSSAEVIIGSMATANENVEEAIAVITDEWRKLAEDGVTQEELDAAKTYLMGEYPLRFDGNGPIADIMLSMQNVDLTPSYVTDRNGFIDAVTLDDVNRVAAELLRPDALRFVVVGQPVTGLEDGTVPTLDD